VEPGFSAALEDPEGGKKPAVPVESTPSGASVAPRTAGDSPALKPEKPAGNGPDEEQKRSLQARFEGFKTAVATRRVREVVPYLDPEFLGRAPLGAWKRPWMVVRRLAGGIEESQIPAAVAGELSWEDQDRKIARLQVAVPRVDASYQQLWVLRDGGWFLLPPLHSKETRAGAPASP
jgi:hypothetical protein